MEKDKVLSDIINTNIPYETLRNSVKIKNHLDLVRIMYLMV